MGDWAVQSDSGVRFEWGPAGAGRLAAQAACLGIVDVLSSRSGSRRRLRPRLNPVTPAGH